MQNQEKSLDECPKTKFNHFEWLFKSCDVVLFMLEKAFAFGFEYRLCTNRQLYYTPVL